MLQIGSARFVNCTFDSNRVTGRVLDAPGALGADVVTRFRRFDGGGLLAFASAPTSTGLAPASTGAGASGPAPATQLAVVNSTFCDNFALGSGGGVAVWGSVGMTIDVRAPCCPRLTFVLAPPLHCCTACTALLHCAQQTQYRAVTAI